ncbi:hypothetical protein [Micromonospora sp. HK10]|uniref:hypothetical protein n=1 Tax=Micromonospora sp. HK10 TaxID=1538294 RepID=UPI0006966045|nr:hypothetical protein [Micromonospora sp. HK10]
MHSTLTFADHLRLIDEGATGSARLPEIAVYTHDAQRTLGAPQPLPDEVALDGFDYCQFTLCATTAPWPHDPAVVDYHATEGRSWRLRLPRDGARVTRLGAPAAGEDRHPADASAQGTARDLPGSPGRATEGCPP